MPNFYPSIYKKKLTKGFSYLLKYADFEELFSTIPVENLCLEVGFKLKQAYFKEDRDHLLEEGVFKICHCVRYISVPNRWTPEVCQDIKGIYTLRVDIFALPYVVLQENALTRVRAQEVLFEELNRILLEGDINQHWVIELSLLTKTTSLRCETSFSSKRMSREIKLKEIDEEE